MFPFASSKSTTALAPDLLTPDSSELIQLGNVRITTLESGMFAESVTHSCASSGADDNFVYSELCSQANIPTEVTDKP